MVSLTLQSSNVLQMMFCGQQHAVRLSCTLKSLCGFKRYGSYVGYLTMCGRIWCIIFQFVCSYLQCGVIECIPDCKSRDQLGKLTRGSLNDYFYDKFGNGDSQPYQKVCTLLQYIIHVIYSKVYVCCDCKLFLYCFFRQEPTLFTAWLPIPC